MKRSIFVLFLFFYGQKILVAGPPLAPTLLEEEVISHEVHVPPNFHEERIEALRNRAYQEREKVLKAIMDFNDIPKTKEDILTNVLQAKLKEIKDDSTFQQSRKEIQGLFDLDKATRDLNGISYLRSIYFSLSTCKRKIAQDNSAEPSSAPPFKFIKRNND